MLQSLCYILQNFPLFMPGDTFWCALLCFVGCLAGIGSGLFFFVCNEYFVICNILPQIFNIGKSSLHFTK